MTLHAVPTRGTSYLLVDERGHPVGEIIATRYALEYQPPEDTVYLVRETKGGKVRRET